jgi:hypothetical protein
MNKVDDLVFEFEKQGTYVRVYKTNIGYNIESVMPNRDPQSIVTKYRSSEKYSGDTDWSVKKLLRHGYYEEWGFIKPFTVKGLNGRGNEAKKELYYPAIYCPFCGVKYE